MSSRPIYVLDTYALMAYFNREAGRKQVREVLREFVTGQSDILMTEINRGEFYYMMAKKANQRQADLRVRHVERLRIDIVPVTRTLVKSAADFKILYSTSKSALSFADCFAAALAQQTGATLLTGDPEFSNLKDVISIRWLTTTP